MEQIVIQINKRKIVNGVLVKRVFLICVKLRKEVLDHPVIPIGDLSIDF